MDVKPRGFWPGFIIGIFYFSYVFWWLWDLYPLDSLGVENKFLSIFLIFFVFFLSVAGTAFFWGIFTYLSVKLSKRIRMSLIALLISSVFVLAEYLRAWGFGIIWFGSGSIIGPYWTFGNPAYLLSFSRKILGIASVFGIYGIDFLIIYIPTLAFLVYHKRSKKLFSFQLFTIIILLAFANNFPNLKNIPATLNRVRVSIIQTETITGIGANSDNILADFRKKTDLLKEASKESKIVVFPETANFSGVLSKFIDSKSAQRYFNQLSEDNVMVLDNIRSQEKEGVVSRTLFIHSKTGIAGFNDKRLLTPGGEYLPYIIKLPLWVFGRRSVQEFSSSQEFSEGIKFKDMLFEGQAARIAICSDIVSPGFFRGNDYGFIIMQSSMGIFEGSEGMESQLVKIIRFRAAENKKPAILASNYGRSYIINPQGNIEEKTDSSGYQILTADVVPNNMRTWYNKLGDLPILLLSLAIFGYGLRDSFKKRYHVE